MAKTSKPRFLIVNADDFGYTSGVNKGIVKAHIGGIVTATSLMTHGLAAPEVSSLETHPSLSVGLHFSLDHEPDLARLVERPDELTAKELTNVQGEFEQQLGLFRELTGREPDHLDFHKHRLHVHPQLAPFFEQQGRDLQVRVRGLFGVGLIEDFFGWDDSGEKDPELITPQRLTGILKELPDGISELVCHPGEPDARLSAISRYASERGIELETLTNPSFQELDGIRRLNSRETNSMIFEKSRA